MDQQFAPGRNQLLASIASLASLVLEQNLKPFPLKQGDVLYEAGAPIRHVYFPTSGLISSVTVMETGRMVETGAIGREGIVGSSVGLNIPRAFDRSIVQIGGASLRMSSSAFVAALQQSERLRQLINRYHAVLLAHAQQSIACNALHPLEARLSRWLLQSRDRADSDSLPVTQEFLSEMLGVQRTTVTLVQSTFKSTGLIRTHRGGIDIVDVEGLRRSACECYGVMKRRFHEILPELSASPPGGG